jgi:small-conductance mechanosensitive channel
MNRLLILISQTILLSFVTAALVTGAQPERQRGGITQTAVIFEGKVLLRAGANALLATCLLVLALLLLRLAGSYVRSRFTQWAAAASARAERSTVWFFVRHSAPVLLLLETAVRWLLVAILFYIYIPLVLGFFPNTAGLSQKLFAWIWSPLQFMGAAFLAYLPNLFFLAFISLVVYAAVRLNRLVFAAVGAGQLAFKGFQQEWANPTAKLVRVLIIAIGVIVAYPYLPASDSPAFKALSVFIGVLLSIGSSSAVANATAGIILIYTRAFRDGDRIRMGDLTGDIVERSLFVTRIRTIKNEIITVPNSTVMTGPIVNFSAEAPTLGLILHTSITIGYDAPWRTVHKLLIDAALETPGVLSNPAPFVLQTSLNDFNVTYELNAVTERANEMVVIYSELHRNIQDTFNKARVEIMSPNYLALRDGNRTTIPAENLPRGYEQPAFKHHFVAPENTSPIYNGPVASGSSTPESVSGSQVG